MNYRFRKKPVVIEAFQMTLERRADNADWPQWLHQAWKTPSDQPGSICSADFPNLNGTAKLQVRTLEGIMTVDWGDWIIRGVKGELYPCKPDIFAATYETA
jgi:hypothetical protein